jgi:hypothetical protein
MVAVNGAVSEAVFLGEAADTSLSSGGLIVLVVPRPSLEAIYLPRRHGGGGSSCCPHLLHHLGIEHSPSSSSSI